MMDSDKLIEFIRWKNELVNMKLQFDRFEAADGSQLQRWMKKRTVN